MRIYFEGKSSLHLLHKRAVRIITNSNYIAHTEPLLKELSLLKVTCIFSGNMEILLLVNEQSIASVF